MSTGIDNPYLGYTIFQFNPTSDDEVKTLQDLEEERNDGVIFLMKSLGAEVGKAMDIMVKPGLREEFIVKLEARGLTPKNDFTVRNSFKDLRKKTDNSKQETRRRIQREKARLQEIRIAAAQSPPPYALVVAECHLNHNRESNEQQHQNPNCQRHRNFCSLPRTCRQNKVISSGYVLPATHNSLSSAHYSQYYANNSLTTGEATSDTISEVNELRSGMSNEPPPPSYEDALKREMVMTESLNRL
ncbi:unnamed protein product [Orchesella dallaii]|uniref:Carboxypeptidase activation peptide domain-containing protein n=1 Tax=Orchesella dallaii TaxID=48710 RepID=A0ABP1RD24_9HEXA